MVNYLGLIYVTTDLEGKGEKDKTIVHNPESKQEGISNYSER